jgi:uncharacterized protein YheU (UPF0270 family)
VSLVTAFCAAGESLAIGCAWCTVSTMVIPPNMLSESALRCLIAEFVTRDGDSDDEAAKIASVHRQIASGDVVIVFDHETETSNLMLKRDLP